MRVSHLKGWRLSGFKLALIIVNTRRGNVLMPQPLLNVSQVSAVYKGIRRAVVRLTEPVSDEFKLWRSLLFGQFVSSSRSSYCIGSGMESCTHPAAVEIGGV